jgi:hypothetical protein
MMRSVSVSHLRPEFQDFLYAPVGDDRNGMLLSVLSALARLNVDPWQEAAELSYLPRATAIQRLASLLAALPGGSSAYPDIGNVAARLIALLPRRPGPEFAARGKPFGTGSLSKKHLLAIYIAVAVLALVLSVRNILESRQPPAQGGSARVSDISSDVAKARPTGSGK